VGLKIVLDEVEKRKFLAPPGLEHRIKSVIANERNSQIVQKTPVQ
jgi:hypothetical protein